MADYVSPAIPVDQTSIEAEIYEYIQTFFPEWDPREPHLAVVLSEAFAALIAENRELITDVSPEIFRYFGTLVGVASVEAAPATGEITIEAVDDSGYEFEEGLTLRVPIGQGEYWGFETSEPAVIAPGDTVSAPVAITALIEGGAGNGLTADPELLDFEEDISSISMVGTTANGSTEEDIDSYLGRLSDRLKLLKDGPVLPEDFAIYTVSLFPEVDRCLALNLYDPDTDTYGNEKYVCVVPVDENGDELESIHPAIEAALAAVREVNFVPKAMKPTYTAVTVDVTVKALPGADPTALEAAVEASVQGYIHPRDWGVPLSTNYTERRREWIKEGYDLVRYTEVMTVVNNTPGVNYIVDEEITINGNVNTSLALAGEAPMPTSGTIVNVTVVPA